MPARSALGLVGALTVASVLLGVTVNTTRGGTIPSPSRSSEASATGSLTAEPVASESAAASAIVSPPARGEERTPVPTAATRPAATPQPGADVASYCAVADRLTPFTGYGDYARTYLDWTYMLPASYAPPDLTPVTSAGLSGQRSAYVRGIVVADLSALRAAASAAGHQLVALSAYRSYAEQESTWTYWVRVGGYDRALRTSARPGHSEHQLGTAIDFSAVGQAPPWEYADWGTTPQGGWLAQNAWRYGFVLSYPAGKQSVTCYDYEPWHFRWIGRDRAAAVRQSGLTLREFLGR